MCNEQTHQVLHCKMGTSCTLPYGKKWFHHDLQQQIGTRREQIASDRTPSEFCNAKRPDAYRRLPRAPIILSEALL